VHNVSIARAEKSNSGLLKMNLTAKTYRYIDEEEAANNQSTKAKKKKKGGKK
jgi:Tfp pilus assembly protein PilO